MQRLGFALAFLTSLASAGCRVCCERVCCPTRLAAPPLEIHPTPRARIDEPEVRDGLVRIAAADEVRGSPLLRYYDVHDLVDADEDKASAVALLPAAGAEDPDLLPPPSLTKTETLVVTIRTLIAPARWAKERWALDAKGGILIVAASPAVHDEIERYLSTLRGEMDPRKG